MEEAGNGGSVVNVSSLAGLGGITGKMGVGHYGVSKWAVNGMTQIAALEYIPSKIRVNAVCPTAIETDLVKSFIENSEDKQASIAMIGSTNPMVGPGDSLPQVSDVTGVISFLCGPDSKFINGALIPIDGGYSIQ